jgi:asparagine synthase (glutamine-hydrolysing)
VEPEQVVLFNLKGELIKKWYYWSFTAVALESLKSPLPDNASVTTEAVHKVLMTAVKGQMSSDVPIGAFLSGGVDSSTVVAMMQAQSAKPIQTFSIGFANKKYDESGYARQVAAHLGCDHSELIVSATEAIAVVPRIPLIYDEPLADPSQIPTVLVSQMARKKVTVALSGDGGDEVFAGYSRYHGVLREWGIISKIPRLARSLALKTVCSESINGIATILESVSIPKRSKYSFLRLLDRLGKASANLGANSIYEYYDARLQVFKEPNNILNAEWLKGSSGNSNVGIKSVSYDTDIDPLLYMQIFDTLRYLPEAILVKVDRAAMAVSLETRVPFLDHRVIDVAWRIPVKGRIGKNSGKIVLKQVLSKYVPQRIIDRPKMGFGIPVCEWLKGPLKDWAEYLLSKPCIGEVGVFRFEPINRMWHEHQSGIRQWHYQLWTVIMFQAWRLESLKFKSLI